jgi:hypothetical protein
MRSPRSGKLFIPQLIDPAACWHANCMTINVIMHAAVAASSL